MCWILSQQDSLRFANNGYDFENLTVLKVNCSRLVWNLLESYLSCDFLINIINVLNLS